MKQMTLDKLLRTIDFPGVSSQLPVLDLTNDSRLVKPGAVFVAVPGYTVDGHRYIPAAVKAGAIAVVAQRHTPGISVPQFIVNNTRQAQAKLAAEFYGNPSRELKLAGITGTNGKTTSTFMLEAIFQAAGLHTGLIGTLYNKVKDIVLPTANTTPDSILCQRLLRDMADAGVTHASMEVSSHAMAMNRVDSTKFTVGALTNFSPDHLDLHQSMAEYRAAKKRFFDMLPADGFAVVNLDDPSCQGIAGDTGARRLSYSLANHKADILLADYQPRDLGGVVTIKVNTQDIPVQPGQITFTLRLPGRHNLANALLAATAALVLGIDAAAISTGLGKYQGIFRRFEVIYNDEYKVIDDAAHNPSNIDAVFRAIMAENPPGVSVVYAIRGSRGVHINQAIASTLADWAKKIKPQRLIITNCTDTASPLDTVLPQEEEVFRSELAGLDADVHFKDTLRQAVSLAVEGMDPGETLLLLGAHPMDEVAGLFSELAEVKTTTRPRPPRFGSH
ncbi:MAG: UDP-N-acetylmuramoyl-L-alanyl-D-glutamate--2,6-diaminopimelate ligase [Eubacteriales bacterium]|nr:UDP-N-acetylmuramoyl-L-alanyl-D-glutamate--2,6-diaminopimelate ligase [Eubacteriales bacterium]MDD4078794.1 UDP-N-acetylmuramoyl-L-alanyl-D-glutamate--2,6-diaminopimelate ligase [Eubacteriales bacterium]